MKIVLRENIDQLGRRGDVVKVASGYGRNYLLPKGLAYLATPGTLQQVRAESRKKEVHEAQERGAARSLAEGLGALGPLTFSKKAGEEDALYGSVTTGEIAEALEQKGFAIERRRIVLSAPIKTLGSHAVSVRLYHDVTAEIAVEVVAEES